MPLELGLYIDRDSFLHRLDPRSKLIMVVTAIFYPALINNPLYSGILFILLILMCILGRLTLLRFLIIMYATAVFTIASLILWPTYIVEGKPIVKIVFPWGWVYQATDLGLMYAIHNVFRIVAPVIAMILYVSVTKPYHIVQAIDKMHLPYKLGMAIAIALRFIPVMFNEAIQIIDAQSARGQELKRGSLIKKIRNFLPIFVPLLVRMIRITIVTSMSLEARAFGSSKRRTYREEIKFTKRDYLFSTLWIGLLVVAVVLRITGLGILPIRYA